MVRVTQTRLVLFFFLALIIIAIVILYSLNDVTQTQIVEIEGTPEFQWETAVRLKPLAVNYTQKLFDVHLKYISEPEPCSSGIFTIILVTSYFGNVETRSAMRRAFSSKELEQTGIKRVFLLGEAPNDKYTKQNAISNEASRFGDLVQGNFLEAYRNLTYKHIMGLKWATENCYKAQYIIKMDDDIVVNLRKMMRVLDSTSFPKNLVAGYILRKMVPIREPANKWYVSESEYPYPAYPPFVSGWFYVTTPRIAAKFVLLSNYFNYFWIDDLYVTGILARNLKIKHYDLGKYFTVHPEILECCIHDINSKQLECDVLVGPNGGDNNLFYRFNEVVKHCETTVKCAQRSKPINETCVAEKKFNFGRGDGIIETYKLH